TQRRAMLVTRRLKKAPEIRLESVVGQPQANGGRQAIQPGQTVTVATPRVRVTGRVQAEGKLATAAWGKDEKSTKALKGFAPKAQAEFTIDEDIALEPGAQVLHFRAQTSGGGDSESTVTVAYQPPVPGVTITAPEDGTVLVQGKDAAEVKVQ